MRTASNKASLVADIGGSNARFAIAKLGSDGRPQISGVQQYNAADFESLTLVAQHYLKTVAAKDRPLRAVMAVASPVTGDTIKITNNPWTFSVDQFGRDLGFAATTVINDFAAISMALPLLGPDDLLTIGNVQEPVRSTGSLNRTYAVVGPGTGLGVSGLAVRNGRPTVIEGEGGHVAFAPADAYEAEVLAQLFKRYERVSIERIASGTGLVNLYQAVCAIEKVAPEFTQAADIAAAAAADPAGISARVIKLFCGILGSFAGDIAMAYGAWDGVFLAGGVAQKLLHWITGSDFRARFEAKGRHRELMQTVPSRAILNPHVGLVGAAAQAFTDSK